VAVTSRAPVVSAFRRKEWPGIPFLWALVYVALFAIVFFKIPFSLGDTYSHLAGPALSSWRDAFVDAFTARGREYRPFFTLGIKAAYGVAGTWLPFYQSLVLLLFGALLTLVVWLCRPVGRTRGVAACVAVSCLCGLHTSRILFGFWPLNHYAAVMVTLLIAVGLAMHPGTRRHDWVFGLLMLVATLSLEFGILIVPVLTLLWWFGAPGISWRGVAAMLGAVAVYGAIRFTFGDHSGALTLWADSGFGFQNLDANALRARFGGAPWVLWIYNVAGTMLTVLFSEPRDGVYSFVESLLARDMETWQWFQVGSSTLTTLVIAAGLVRGWPWKEERRQGVPGDGARDRLLVVAGGALLVFGSVLSFVYTRDRLGLAGGIGYALLLYVAIGSWLDRDPGPGTRDPGSAPTQPLVASAQPHVASTQPHVASAFRRKVATTLLALVAAVWVIRSAETWFQLRDTAWDYHVEWTDRFVELGGAQNSTDLMRELRTTALAKTPADVRLDPAWTYVLFERRFHRMP
jgi:hypothetical protein